MLLINTAAGQSINIGEDVSLKVCSIDTDEVEFELIEHGQKMGFSLAVGSTTQLLPKVVMAVTKVLIGSKPIVALGFDAPLDIRIRGDWARNLNKNP